MKRKFNMTKTLLGIYCLLLIWIIIFKTAFTFTEVKLLLGNRSINLIPFYYQEIVSFQFREVILNLIIFIPFGLYLKMLDITTKKSILYGMVFSVVLESCQFIFGIGASDITDIITNTLGTTIGVCSYIFISEIFSNKMKMDKVINAIVFIAILFFFVLAMLLFVAN